ncbi:MAG: hypothetical protein GY714_20170 [Desulfobacterales bacterium]|nr:hypothetical protein [Desulfobacterales bacterium]
MANNRLFVGNTKTKEWVMLAKGFGNGWNTRLVDKLDAFIRSWEFICESDVGCKTQFFFFTEYDNIHAEVFDENSEWKEYKETK